MEAEKRVGRVRVAGRDEVGGGAQEGELGEAREGVGVMRPVDEVGGVVLFGGREKGVSAVGIGAGEVGSV